MAKTQVPSTTDKKASTSDDTKAASSRTLKAVETLRGPFMAFVADFTSITTKRAELAPKVMKVFGTWQSEVGGSFVEFTRILDPTIGATREEYRKHRSYQAADYLRRLAALTVARARTGAATRAPAISPTAGMARLLKAVLPLIDAGQIDKLWQTLTAELHWSDRQTTNMQRAVDDAATDPLVRLTPPRGTPAASVPRLHVVAVRHTEEVGERKTA